MRAQSIRGRMALEGLYVPVNADWYPALRSGNLLSFPSGKARRPGRPALGLVGSADCWICCMKWLAKRASGKAREAGESIRVSAL